MSMFSQNNRFGAHADVLSAKPEDPAGQVKLSEEIKSRARAEFGRKNLPQADMLYSKGIEIKPDDATLHSNLAAVRLGLNQPGPALKCAEEAVRLDASYAKGHYRKGQALMALSRPAEAADAFRVGSALEPVSKLWPPLVEKAVKAIEDLRKAAAEAPNDGKTTAVSKTVVAARTTSGAGTRATSKTVEDAAASSSSSSSSGIRNASSSLPGGAAGMKGYKKTADGKVTTYFHNELSEEAKALIGDIAPKRLDPVGAVAGDVSPTNDAAGGSGASNEVSAWNKAGTWESRDMTSWAKHRLTELLMGVSFDAPESEINVIKIEKLEGDAEISFSRGKKRYMFDFRFELNWQAPDLEGGPAKGKLVYPDVGQDCEGVYEAECQVDGNTPPANKSFVDRHVRSEGSGLRQAILGRLNIFAEEFNAK